MTTKADFTEEEWDTILEGPPAAGLLVSLAERGGTFREAFSIAKAYGEARRQHGASELLDEIVSAKPEVDRSRHASPEDMRSHSLEKIRKAVGTVEQKADSQEAADYRAFIVSLAERVAAAKGDEPASAPEQQAIEEIRTALG